MSDSAEQPAILPLTGLRFVVAFLVFLSHYPIFAPTGGANGPLRIFMFSGYVGVTFFFVLSGFILTYNHLGEFEARTPRRLGRYFVSRFARIYPLYAFCILYAWLSGGGASPLWPYLLALQAWSPDVYVAMGLDGPAWTISVEVFLYLCFPLLIAGALALNLPRKRTALLIAGVLVIGVMFALVAYFEHSGRGSLPSTDPTSAHRWLYRTPLTRVLDFALGMVSAIYFMRFARYQRQGLWTALTLIAAAAVVVMMSSSRIFDSAGSWQAFYAVPFSMIILGLSISPKSIPSKLLSTPAMLLLGEASYALYLLHVLMWPLHTTTATGVTLLFRNLLFTALVFATAIGAYVAIERPCRRFIRKLGAVALGRSA